MVFRIAITDTLENKQMIPMVITTQLAVLDIGTDLKYENGCSKKKGITDDKYSNCDFSRLLLIKNCVLLTLEFFSVFACFSSHLLCDKTDNNQL